MIRAEVIRSLLRMSQHQVQWASRWSHGWADPAYEVVHASIVPCNANLLAGLRGPSQAETTGADNLETMRLVFAAYDSAAEHRVITL